MASQYISNSTVTYDVSPDGTTTVTHDIILQNTTSDFYVNSYTLSLTGISPLNSQAFEGNQALPIEVSENNGTTSFTINFPDAVVGKDSKREFIISFLDRTLVQKTGEIWEMTTLKLGDPTAFDLYSTLIKVPDSFGQLAYISQNPTFKSNQNGKMLFGFDKDASIKNTITSAFGQFQVFSFNLTYHLENPLNQSATIDIALPPDTNYQKVTYTNITTKPSRVHVDSDGNWVATFNLKPYEKNDVKATGAVQLFASPLGTPKLTPGPADLAPTDLWQTQDPQIQALAKRLKTPRAIYDFVLSTLSYDYTKAAPNNKRLGAVSALQNPKNAICTEFTDLFVAIARAAGIPTREMEGYAYANNPRIQPLSLVPDALHAWPEYWDNAKQVWIPVDPTWGSTSGNNYFDRLDLNHFSFVTHGTDPIQPYPAGSYKLGTDPQKDVDVTFGSLPQNRVANIQIENQTLAELPFSDEIIDTKIKNTGSVAVYDQSFQILYDNGSPVSTKNIDVIPPYGYYETNIDIPYSFLGQKVPSKVQLLVSGVKRSEFGTYKTYVTVSNLLMILLFIFLTVMLVYLKFRDVAAKRHIK